MRRLVQGSVVFFVIAAAGPAAAQSPATFDACYVPQVGALYLIGLPGLPEECLDEAHVAISWSEGGGDGTVTSVSAGDGLLGGTITTSGTLAVDFAGPGSEATVARSDHTHMIGGTANTAVGTSALEEHTTGEGNTAVGHEALRENTGGQRNTAVGKGALLGNVSGANSTAVGYNALLSSNAAVAQNTAVGVSALQNTTSGRNNTAIGVTAMLANVTGSDNTAVGIDAMRDAAAGSENTAVGRFALRRAEGSRNIGIGRSAGAAVTTGSDNIHIGHAGFTADDRTIRIGHPAEKDQAFIAGISGVTSSGGVGVFVNADGQLGTLTSSARAKEEIEDLGGASRRVLDLRPVRFRYRPEHDDGSRLVQYGLIAEEVAEAFPELAQRGREGAVETVRYHLLPVLLLNELQRQEREAIRLRRTVASQAREIAALRMELEEVRTRIEAIGVR